MNPADYEYLSNFLIGTSGLSLGEGKEYLLEARLIPLAQSLDLSGIEELVAELKNNPELKLESAVTEAMTTNETSFFRDKAPFVELQEKLLPAIIENGKTTRKLRIWCAAAATGQEPLTIKMVLKENFPELASWNVEIVCTDIDKSALYRCEKGIYSQFEVQRGLPVQYLMKYFDQCPTGWQAKPVLLEGITWTQLNLLNNFSNLGSFDIVFCRNVLIYFQIETKKEILERMAYNVKEDGYLYLGAAETVLGITDKFQRFKECTSAVYIPASQNVPSLTSASAFSTSK